MLRAEFRFFLASHFARSTRAAGCTPRVNPGAQPRGPQHSRLQLGRGFEFLADPAQQAPEVATNPARGTPCGELSVPSSGGGGAAAGRPPALPDSPRASSRPSHSPLPPLGSLGPHHIPLPTEAARDPPGCPGDGDGALVPGPSPERAGVPGWDPRSAAGEPAAAGRGCH